MTRGSRAEQSAAAVQVNDEAHLDRTHRLEDVREAPVPIVVVVGAKLLCAAERQEVRLRVRYERRLSVDRHSDLPARLCRRSRTLRPSATPMFEAPLQTRDVSSSTSRSTGTNRSTGAETYR